MPFMAVLRGVAETLKGSCLGAIVCDDEGEKIQSLVVEGGLSAYDLDVAGACLAGVAALAEPGGVVRALRLQEALVVGKLNEGCFVVVIVPPGQTFRVARMLPELLRSLHAIL